VRVFRVCLRPYSMPQPQLLARSDKTFMRPPIGLTGTLVRVSFFLLTNNKSFHIAFGILLQPFVVGDGDGPASCQLNSSGEDGRTLNLL
jgi:hypothetical protein